MTGKKYSVYWYAIVNIIFGLNDGVEYNFKVEYWNDIQSSKNPFLELLRGYGRA